MATDPDFDLDYAAVDGGSNTAHLVATMDAVTAWPAIVTLRAWERERLALRTGERLLDVGCGPGDAAVALAADLGATGEVVAVDASETMLGVAATRAAGVAGSFRVVVGDASSLD